MAITFQKIILASSLFALSSLVSLSHAQTLKSCGQGSLMVGQKMVGTAQYKAERCGSNWKHQSIQMDFAYQENIPEWAFKRAANYLLNKNLSKSASLTALRSITELYQPVKAGDRYQLNYQHESQTLTLYLNQKRLGRLQHAEAQEYFNIWLGPQPFSATLKQQLLN